MKIIIHSFLFMLLSISAYAQIDNQNKSISIPVIKSKTDSSNNTIFTSANNTSDSFNGLSIPKTTSEINIPKKDFSMFGETFGNPGELYKNQINKNLENVKLTAEEIEQRNGSKTDQYFGDFKSKAKFVNVVYRDHGIVDGDLIQVRVNDDVIKASVFLIGGFKGFKLNLQSGFNKIDFVALNQGESGPNTAEFQVVDDASNLVSSNRWNLATGAKATIIVVKE